jgi:hypothetical protein
VSLNYTLLLTYQNQRHTPYPKRNFSLTDPIYTYQIAHLRSKAVNDTIPPHHNSSRPCTGLLRSSMS